jgi:hypothetical protein
MTESLTYQGKQIPIRCSYYALKKTSQEIEGENGIEKNDVIDMQSIMGGDITVLEPLLFHAVVAGCHADKIEVPITREEAVWVLDENFNQFVKALSTFFQKENGKKGEALTPQKTILKKK